MANAATGEVIFTPPEGEDIIRNKLKNLEGYIHAEDEVDSLIKLALIHYQFEATTLLQTATPAPAAH